MAARRRSKTTYVVKVLKWVERRGVDELDDVGTLKTFGNRRELRKWLAAKEVRP